MASFPTTKSASIATAFVRKLYRMLDVEDTTVIGWDASGQSFSIRDAQQLDERILPRYFRGRVDVFRQHLAEHSFHRSVVAVHSASRQQPIETFTHQHFVRGQPNRLSQIIQIATTKRRRSRLTKKRTDTPSSSVQTTGTRPLEPAASDHCAFSSSLLEDNSFDFCALLDSASCFPPIDADEGNQTDGNDKLHDSLARILALHATNPVSSSLSMARDPSLSQNCDQMPFSFVETPLFTTDMMASMVEWLDTTA